MDLRDTFVGALDEGEGKEIKETAELNVSRSIGFNHSVLFCDICEENPKPFKYKMVKQLQSLAKVTRQKNYYFEIPAQEFKIKI
jgi:hypothetical protein